VRKTLKILGIALGSVLALLILAAVALPLLFDPNQYRDDIVKAVKTATGRDLRIEKKIGWSLFPRLGIEAGGLELSNAPGFGKEPFARLDSAAASVEWLPLFSGKVRVDAFHLDGLTLNLAKNAAGRTNWEDLTAAPAAAPTKPEPPKAGEKPLPLAAFAAGKLEVRRATINWHDQASGARYAVRGLALATGPVAVNAPVDIKLSLALEHGTPPRRTPVSLATRVVYAADALALKDLKLAIDDSRLTGSAEIRNLQAPAYRFDLSLDQFDLDKYLPPASEKKAAPATPAAAAAAAPIEIPLGLVRALDVQGKFAIGKLKAFGLRSEDIRIQLTAGKGLIQLGPNTAKLYSGTYNGRTALDVRGATPQLNMEEQLTGIQLGPFLKDAGVFDKFSGGAELRLALAAQGADADRIKRTLNGTVAVAATNGKIEGVNLQKLIADAKRLRDTARGKTVSVAAAPADETAFSALRATIKVTNGVAATDDLALEGPVVRAKGKGSADLVKEKLDARLNVTVAEGAERKGTTVPVLIGGTFAKPSFGVDLGEVAKREAEKAVEKELERQIEKLRKNKKKR
jgi:AsmA protein